MICQVPVSLAVLCTFASPKGFLCKIAPEETSEFAGAMGTHHDLVILKQPWESVHGELEVIQLAWRPINASSKQQSCEFLPVGKVACCLCFVLVPIKSWVTIELTNSHEPSWGGVGSIFSYANIASDIIHFAGNFDLESAKVHICISNQCS